MAAQKIHQRAVRGPGLDRSRIDQPHIGVFAGNFRPRARYRNRLRRSRNDCQRHLPPPSAATVAHAAAHAVCAAHAAAHAAVAHAAHMRAEMRSAKTFMSAETTMPTKPAKPAKPAKAAHPVPVMTGNQA